MDFACWVYLCEQLRWESQKPSLVDIHKMEWTAVGEDHTKPNIEKAVPKQTSEERNAAARVNRKTEKCSQGHSAVCGSEEWSVRGGE
jgi:hypothetical protein